MVSKMLEELIFTIQIPPIGQNKTLLYHSDLCFSYSSLQMFSNLLYISRKFLLA